MIVCNWFLVFHYFIVDCALKITKLVYRNQCMASDLVAVVSEICVKLQVRV